MYNDNIHGYCPVGSGILTGIPSKYLFSGQKTSIRCSNYSQRFVYIPDFDSPDDRDKDFEDFDFEANNSDEDIIGDYEGEENDNDIDDINF